MDYYILAKITLLRFLIKLVKAKIVVQLFFRAILCLLLKGRVRLGIKVRIAAKPSTNFTMEEKFEWYRIRLQNHRNVSRSLSEDNREKLRLLIHHWLDNRNR